MQTIISCDGEAVNAAHCAAITYASSLSDDGGWCDIHATTITRETICLAANVAVSKAPGVIKAIIEQINDEEAVIDMDEICDTAKASVF